MFNKKVLIKRYIIRPTRDELSVIFYMDSCLFFQNRIYFSFKIVHYLVYNEQSINTFVSLDSYTILTLKINRNNDDGATSEANKTIKRSRFGFI